MTDADRLDRIEARLDIGQLAVRYAFAVDSRDLDALVALYVDDVTRPDVVGVGREPLRRHFEKVLRGFYRTMHQILGHQIDLVAPDRATGKVYCRAEHERGDEWMVLGLCYEDDYERRDGTWYFARRALRPLYRYYAADRPRAPFIEPEEASMRSTLPGAWPTWSAFWAEVPPSEAAGLTRQSAS